MDTPCSNNQVDRKSSVDVDYFLEANEKFQFTEEKDEWLLFRSPRSLLKPKEKKLKRKCNFVDDFEVAGGLTLIFCNQVSGHTPFLKKDNKKITKVASSKEVKFYEFMNSRHPELAKWSPSYFGSQHVSLDRFLKLISNLSSGLSQHQNAIRHCYDKFLSKKWQEKGGTVELITLEDLTQTFENPCILDLKMGIRQHGINVSSEKVKSQTLKARSTTSFKLGFRFNGMQVWNKQNLDYVNYSKYWGRNISVDGVPKALSTYFSNGEGIRRDVIHKFVEKLEALYQDLYNSPLQLYSASILFIYDGCFSENSDVTVKVIDFAHSETVHDHPADDWNQIAPDCGFLLGIGNLIKYLRKFEGNDDDFLEGNGSAQAELKLQNK
eukprot:CAMPEP_0117889682 /NCGR_PEP_ID=MMETSP0950-20121206/22763_1 /TAXON_ID=44440 /ORGANISM="Chattonella subsalsa, Strain CCMP2191" /LENGTH=379 /DNA_ID=CAMNT_0005748571 /DNA_START=65 /DNA_END=1202 /DNA_ORIENTATION=-